MRVNFELLTRRTYEFLSKNPVPRGWTHIAMQGLKSAWTVVDPTRLGWPRELMLHTEMAHWCSVPIGADVTYALVPQEVWFRLFLVAIVSYVLSALTAVFVIGLDFNLYTFHDSCTILLQFLDERQYFLADRLA